MSYFGTSDFLLRVKQDLVPGYSYNTIFGEIASLNIADGYQKIWDGSSNYSPPTQARIHDIVSTDVNDAGTVISSGTMTGGSLTTIEDSSATFVTDGVTLLDRVVNDDLVTLGQVTAVTETTITVSFSMRNPSNGRICDPNAAGHAYRVISNASSGASYVYIRGVGDNFVAQEEFVVLNGTTAVPTTKTWLRQYQLRAFGKNTDGVIGVVTATAQTDSTITSQIIDGNNQALMAIYTVPIDKTAYIIDWSTSLVGGTVNKNEFIRSRLRVGRMNNDGGGLTGIGYIGRTSSVSALGTSNTHEDLNYYQVPGSLDIWIESSTDTDGVAISGGFDVILSDF